MLGVLVVFAVVGGVFRLGDRRIPDTEPRRA
jgi:hypothetical protein